jgi:hypothetical protein
MSLPIPPNPKQPTSRRRRKPPTPNLHARRDGGAAFIPEPIAGEVHTNDDLAENLAEFYLQSATSGEEQGEERFNEFVTEELGGPFIEEDEDLPPPPDDLPR